MLFGDRVEAGRRLVELLGDVDGSAVVLALPRGGVPVGSEVAEALGAPLEVLVARKLGAPGRPELGVGAIAEGAGRVVNDRAVGMLGLTERDLDEVERRERDELARRVRRYRGDRPLPDLSGATAILVDDGLATGGTAEVALHSVRAMGPAELVLAVPVAPRETVQRLEQVADRVVCVDTPPDFMAVGQFYRNFEQTTDDEVVALLEAAQRRVRSRST